MPKLIYSAKINLRVVDNIDDGVETYSKEELDKDVIQRIENAINLDKDTYEISIESTLEVINEEGVSNEQKNQK